MAVVYFPTADKENMMVSNRRIDHSGLAFPVGDTELDSMARINWLQRFEDADLKINEPTVVNKSASDYGGDDFSDEGSVVVTSAATPLAAQNESDSNVNPDKTTSGKPSAQVEIPQAAHAGRVVPAASSNIDMNYDGDTTDPNVADPTMYPGGQSVFDPQGQAGITAGEGDQEEIQTEDIDTSQGDGKFEPMNPDQNPGDPAPHIDPANVKNSTPLITNPGVDAGTVSDDATTEEEKTVEDLQKDEADQTREERLDEAQDDAANQDTDKVTLDKTKSEVEAMYADPVKELAIKHGAAEDSEDVRTKGNALSYLEKTVDFKAEPAE